MVRHFASEALGWSATIAKAATPDLIQGINDSDERVQLNCIRALVQINSGHPEIDRVLMAACSNANFRVASCAASVLAYTGRDTPEVRTAISNALGGDIWSLEAFAGELNLQHWPKRENIEEQIADLERISFSARVQAIQALRTNYLEAAKIIPALARLLHDKQMGIRMVATDVLAEYGTNARLALPALREMDAGTNQFFREKLDNAIRLIEDKGFP